MIGESDPVVVLMLRATIAPLLLVMIRGAQQRFGPRFAGALAGLPVTSGPIFLLVGLEQGAAFARQQAAAATGAVLAQYACCGAYAGCVMVTKRARAGGLLSVATAVVTFAAVASLLAGLTCASASPIAIAVLVEVLSLATTLLPATRPDAVLTAPVRGWAGEAFRCGAAFALTAGCVLAAADLPPAAVGAISAFPVVAVLALVGIRTSRGSHAAADAARAVVLMCGAVAAFQACAASTVEATGPGVAAALGGGAALATAALNLILAARVRTRTGP